MVKRGCFCFILALYSDSKTSIRAIPVSLETTHNVILNLVQDLTEDWLVKARGEMLKRVQHDVEGIELAHKLILNLVQDLSAVKESRGSR